MSDIKATIRNADVIIMAPAHKNGYDTGRLVGRLEGAADERERIAAQVAALDIVVSFEGIVYVGDDELGWQDTLPKVIADIIRNTRKGEVASEGSVVPTDADDLVVEEIPVRENAPQKENRIATKPSKGK